MSQPKTDPNGETAAEHLRNALQCAGLLVTLVNNCEAIPEPETREAFALLDSIEERVKAAMALL